MNPKTVTSRQPCSCLVALSILLPAIAQANLCREVDGVFERVIAGQVRMDSLYYYSQDSSRRSEFEVVRFRYEQGRLSAVADGVMQSPVSYPATNTVALSISGSGTSLTSRFHLGVAGRVDSIVTLSTLVITRVMFAYTDSTYVRKEYLGDGTLQGIDSILYGPATRTAWKWEQDLEEPISTTYCRTEGERCVCYGNPAYTERTEYEHTFELQGGRLVTVSGGDGARSAEYFWPGGTAIAFRKWRKATEFPRIESGCWRLDGRRLPNLPSR